MSKRKCGIYGIFNRQNGRWYVGQSVDIAGRKFTHFLNLHRRKHGNKLLQKDYDECGKSAFDFLVLEQVACDKSLLDFTESKWIREKGSCDPNKGYNESEGSMPSAMMLEDLGIAVKTQS